LNVGEGVRRAPEFVCKMIYSTKYVDSSDQCQPETMDSYREQLWNAILD